MNILYQNLKKEGLSKINNFKSGKKSKNKKTKPKPQKGSNSENDTPVENHVNTNSPEIVSREPIHEEVLFTHKSNVMSSLISR